MATKKEATHQNGKNKGKLKPGYRYGKGGRIIKSGKSISKKRIARSKKSIQGKLFRLFK